MRLWQMRLLVIPRARCSLCCCRICTFDPLIQMCAVLERIYDLRQLVRKMAVHRVGLAHRERMVARYRNESPDGGWWGLDIIYTNSEGEFDRVSGVPPSPQTTALREIGWDLAPNELSYSDRQAAASHRCLSNPRRRQCRRPYCRGA
jgi:hypothetical protein